MVQHPGKTPRQVSAQQERGGLVVLGLVWLVQVRTSNENAKTETLTDGNNHTTKPGSLKICFLATAMY